MTVLSHIKLVNGDDIVAFVTEMDEETEIVTLEHPIQFVIDPNIGTYGRKWLSFSEGSTCKIDAFNVLFVNVASSTAAELYMDIVSRSSVGDDHDDLEDLDSPSVLLH